MLGNDRVPSEAPLRKSLPLKLIKEATYGKNAFVKNVRNSFLPLLLSLPSSFSSESGCCA